MLSKFYSFGREERISFSSFLLKVFHKIECELVNVVVHKKLAQAWKDSLIKT